VVFNGLRYSEIKIDPHYEVKHGESISDILILDLLKRLGNEDFPIAAEGNGYSYYECDVVHHGKLYRLILVIPFDKVYLGVRNVYRRSK
jgi:hypothetical protein